MKQVNFNHLQYFYAVAKEGSVTAAAARLNVTPQTVSGQLATFEEYIEARLFERHGKRLELNELGKTTMRYAEDIFSLGTELSRALATKEAGLAVSFNVGIVDAIPKVMAFDMLDACFDLDQSFKLECHEGDLRSLLADLSVNKLDLIISDQPLPTGVSIRARSHYLGESGVTFFAATELAAKIRDDFPRSLHCAPFLMPGAHSAQKQNLLAWFESMRIAPNVVAEFDDSALLKIFGQVGRGVFCVTSSIESDILARYDVEVVGRVDALSDRFYGIAPERKINHPGIDAVLGAAKSMLQQASHD
ncbi:transcriptional activator NhaR [Arenicella xantha]|uniref:LysR family transcriptional regulator n=1 Tax=Arenicella xantha TaxID=644221 RepID=A0A395JQ39_9GAMM|nr:transcriptional activator NhaR [Arenicella xantha]RBP51654.1 LysR family transcriptional regulator [Arenicella xantha]